MVNRRIMPHTEDLISYGIIVLIGIFLIFTTSISSIEQITAQGSSEDPELTDQGSETETDGQGSTTDNTGPEASATPEEEEDQSANSENGEVETSTTPGQIPSNGGDQFRTTAPEEEEGQTIDEEEAEAEVETSTTPGQIPSNGGDQFRTTAPEEEEGQTVDENGAEETETQSNTGTVRIFRSTTDGFQTQIPIGWVVEDIDNTSINDQLNEEQSGYTFLAKICSQGNAVQFMAGIGRYQYQCQEGSTANVQVMKFTDLHEGPEFASDTNPTTSDLILYYTELWQSISGISNIQIWNDTETTVNIIAAQTNQTIATAPAKLIEYTYSYPGEGQTRIMYREFTLLVLNEDTGYALFYKDSASSLPSGRPPPQVQQIFDSFELL